MNTKNSSLVHFRDHSYLAEPIGNIFRTLECLQVPFMHLLRIICK